MLISIIKSFDHPDPTSSPNPNPNLIPEIQSYLQILLLQYFYHILPNVTSPSFFEPKAKAKRIPIIRVKPLSLKELILLICEPPLPLLLSLGSLLFPFRGAVLLWLEATAVIMTF